MDQEDRKHVASVLNDAISVMQVLLEKSGVAIESEALAELVDNFGKQLATAFEVNREVEFIQRWNERVPNFRRSLFSAGRGRSVRAFAWRRIAIISLQDVKTAQELCPPPPDFPMNYR